MAITEEALTIYVINWLKSNGWKILSYDFPQSGTGFCLRASNSTSKTKNVIIPDIVAIKNDWGILFENKDRFYMGDFTKIWRLKNSKEYEASLNILFGGHQPTKLHFGIAFPFSEINIKKAKLHLQKIDFIITVTDSGIIKDYYNPNFINFNG